MREDDERDDAAEWARDQRKSQCQCKYLELPGICPGPANCPMVNEDDNDD